MIWRDFYPNVIENCSWWWNWQYIGIGLSLGYTCASIYIPVKFWPHHQNCTISNQLAGHACASHSCNHFIMLYVICRILSRFIGNVTHVSFAVFVLFCLCFVFVGCLVRWFVGWMYVLPPRHAGLVNQAFYDLINHFMSEPVIHDHRNESASG